MHSQFSARCTLWAGRAAFAAAAVLAVALPELLSWYQNLRPLSRSAQNAILWGYWLCLPGVLYALIQVEKLVKNILAREIFTGENVRRIRRIRWCCAWVSLVCLPASAFYPPLCFLAVIMTFLALVVSLVKNVMAAAVELREENDLTV